MWFSVSIFYILRYVRLFNMQLSNSLLIVVFFSDLCVHTWCVCHGSDHADYNMCCPHCIIRDVFSMPVTIRTSHVWSKIVTYMMWVPWQWPCTLCMCGRHCVIYNVFAMALTIRTLYTGLIKVIGLFMFQLVTNMVLGCRIWNFSDVLPMFCLRNSRSVLCHIYRQWECELIIIRHANSSLPIGGWTA